MKNYKMSSMFPFNYLKLQHKFALAILGNILLVLIVFSIIIDDYYEEKLIQNVQEKHVSIVKNLADDAVDALLVRNYSQLNILVNSAQEAVLSMYAYVLDESGRVVAHTDQKKLGQDFELPKENGFFIEEDSRNGVTIRDFIVPIQVKGEHIGYVVLGINKGKEIQFIANGLHTLRTKLLVVSFGLFSLGIFFSVMLARVLTRRIYRLKARIGQVQQGNLQVETSKVYSISCLEVFDCPYQECPAYGKPHCWTIAHTFNAQQRECVNCPVYKGACGDEIGELELAFDQMVVELRNYLDKLKETTKEKSRLERLYLLGQMSSQMAHEIKNPLNAIHGAAHYIKGNFQGQMLQEFTDVIVHESQRLNDIVSEFLQFSKPGPVQETVTDINVLIRETLKLVDSDIQDSSIELSFIPDEHVKSLPLDAGKIKQAVLNLVINAIQASPEYGQVEVRTKATDGYLKVQVIDAGQGIQPDDIENIFKPFFTKKVHGSGLGLAIVEQNIREQKGTVQVNSLPGQGSTFTITLPVEAA